MLWGKKAYPRGRFCTKNLHCDLECQTKRRRDWSVGFTFTWWYMLAISAEIATGCWRNFSTLVPSFSEFFVPLDFTSFKPFLLREKRVPPTLAIIRRLGFCSHRSLLRYKPVNFTAFFFVSFPIFRRQNIKNLKKLNFNPRVLLKKAALFYVFLSSLFPLLVSKKAYRPTTHFASGEWNLQT